MTEHEELIERNRLTVKLIIIICATVVVCIGTMATCAVQTKQNPFSTAPPP